MEDQLNSESTKNIIIHGMAPSLLGSTSLSPLISQIDFDKKEFETIDNCKYSFQDHTEFFYLNSLLFNQKDKIAFNDFSKLLSKDKTIESFLQDTSLQSNSIDDFLLHILKHKDFKNFETAFLFVHQKGELTATKHEVASSYKRQASFSIKEFNNLFQSIKKSKNRSFGQNELKGKNFNILGTFIAREFSLTHHNIIFIISKNDFLPPTDEELTIFHQFSKSIAFFLNTFLFYHLKSFKRDLLEKVSQEFISSNSKLKINNHANAFHFERLSLLGELLNTLRHELSNPLFGLQLGSQILKEDLTEDFESIEFIDEIIKNIQRSQDIIRNFSDLFIEKNQTKIVNIKEIVEEVITLTKSETRGIIKDVLSEKEVKLNTNPTLFVQVLFNLIINSAQELHRSSIYLPKIKIIIKSHKDEVEIEIIDNGPGISEIQRENIFKPFYTTKEKGTGLGLPISLNIIEKLNGKLTCEKAQSGGHFKIVLPKGDM